MSLQVVDSRYQFMNMHPGLAGLRKMIKRKYKNIYIWAEIFRKGETQTKSLRLNSKSLTPLKDGTRNGQSQL